MNIGNSGHCSAKRVNRVDHGLGALLGLLGDPSSAVDDLLGDALACRGETRLQQRVLVGK